MIKINTQKKKLQCDDGHKQEARKKEKKDHMWSSNDQIYILR